MTSPVGGLDGFGASPFTHDGVTRTVLRAGAGPAVLVITEVPGITPDVAAFARRVRDLGCTVVLPSVIGTPGREPSAGYAAASLARACVSKEFTTWALRRTSPITTWLTALARHEHEACGGPGVQLCLDHDPTADDVEPSGETERRRHLGLAAAGFGDFDRRQLRLHLRGHSHPDMMPRHARPLGPLATSVGQLRRAQTPMISA